MKRGMNPLKHVGIGLALLIAACQVPPPRAGALASSAVTTLPASPATAAPAATSTTGSTLTIGMLTQPATLNIYTNFLWAGTQIIYGIMNSLLRMDNKMQLQSALAESYAVSDDGLTYTFKLRKGVKWHDGQPFTAQDVVATWNMVMNPDYSANDLTGWDKIKSMETPDDYTVVMQLKQVFSPFIIFVGGMARMSPKHMIDLGAEAFKKQFDRAPIGTGAYKVVEWKSDQYILLEKNPDYFEGVPRIDHIVIRFVPDTNTLLVQLRTGEIQMTDELGATDYAAVQALSNNNNLALTGNNWSHIDLKNIDFLMDKRVRQALDYAIPRDQIVNQLLKGLVTPAVGDQSPITPFGHPTLKPRPYDQDKAAELLKSAGFVKNAQGILEKEGKTLTIDYWISAGIQQFQLVQQVIAASWRKLGIEVNVGEQELSVANTQDGFFFSKTMTANGYDWFNAFDPENTYFWNSRFIPKEPGGVGGNMPAVYHPYEQQAKFDALTDEANLEVNPEKRQKIYWQIQELLHEEVPVIFLYWNKRIYVTPKTLAGFDPNAALPLLIDAERWSITQ